MAAEVRHPALVSKPLFKLAHVASSQLPAAQIITTTDIPHLHVHHSPRYLVLITKSAMGRVGSFGPLELTSIALACVSVVLTVKAALGNEGS